MFPCSCEGDSRMSPKRQALSPDRVCNAYWWGLFMTIRKTLLALAGAVSAAAIAVPAQADGVLNFVILGDTFFDPFTITNNSTAGETVVGFGLSLVSPFGFDTAQDGFGINNSRAFTPVGGSGVTTGYTGPASFADGSTSIAFTFNNFNVGESFVWDIDVDGPSQITVLGSDLIGSSAYVDFSNGLRGLGVLEAVPGNSTGAQFVVRTFVTTPGVPEPASWAMLLMGFGAVGTAMRRKASLARA